MEKVLCVDDDLGLLRLYYDELSEEGYEVILAKDGKEALTAMLGKDRQVPVILNTAYPQYRENFMTWGAEAYVLKSSDLTELKRKIKEALDRRKKSAKS
jgi:DNA-binding response OmpR family regulator